MSASVEALAALTQSVEAWDRYRSEMSGPIDLTMAPLKGKDLRGRSFDFCDLSGAELDEANLDQCSFRSATLKAASLWNASMVSCNCEKVDASDAILDYSIVRRSTFTDTNFSNVSLKQARISEDCAFNRCTFDHVSMDCARFLNTSFDGSIFRRLRAGDVEFDKCRLIYVHLTNVTWFASRLTDCDLSFSNISDVEFANGTISEVKMAGADIVRLTLLGTTVGHIDFTDSRIREVDLLTINLPRATMLGTTVMQCRWPRQRPTINWCGRYRKSPALLGQPVQDLRGLSPKLRREIADAQYLDELHRTVHGWPRTFVLWFWGVTTGYGQSILRLTIVTLLLILVLSITFVFAGSHPSPWRDKLTEIPQAFSAVSTAFLSILDISQPKTVDLTIFQNSLLLAARVCGFIVLGLWIALAAQKLGRLSAE